MLTSAGVSAIMEMITSSGWGELEILLIWNREALLQVGLAKCI